MNPKFGVRYRFSAFFGAMRAGRLNLEQLRQAIGGLSQSITKVGVLLSGPISASQCNLWEQNNRKRADSMIVYFVSKYSDAFMFGVVIVEVFLEFLLRGPCESDIF